MVDHISFTSVVVSFRLMRCSAQSSADLVGLASSASSGLDLWRFDEADKVNGERTRQNDGDRLSLWE